MKELIDKVAVIAEIKRLIQANELYLSEPKTDEIRFQKVGAFSVLNDLLHFLDTLEVKEVDLEKELNDFIEEQKAWVKDDRVVEYNNGDSFNHIYDLESVAKHFFELGMAVSNKAQKGDRE